MKIMAFGSITSWQIEGKKVEAVTDFIFLGSKITADSIFSHKITSCLLQGRKDVTNLDNILKSNILKDNILKRYHFSDKGLYSQSWGFSSSHVQMWEMDCKEGWAPKNWHFQFWCWRRLLRVPWTARRSNQSTLKEFNPEYSLEGLMLKLQYFGTPDVKSQLIGKDPMLVKILGRNR